MVTVGIDPHKHVHVAVAVDAAARQVGRPLTVKNCPHLITGLLTWVRSISGRTPVTWAIEDGHRHYFPKGSDFDRITNEHFRAVAAELNDRPRVCLNDCSTPPSTWCRDPSFCPVRPAGSCLSWAQAFDHLRLQAVSHTPARPVLSSRLRDHRDLHHGPARSGC